MRRLRVVSVLLVPLALLAACSGGPETTDRDPAASSSTGSGGEGGASNVAPSACDLLPAEAASEVVGFPVTAQEGPLDVCEYRQDDARATSFDLGAQLESELAGGADEYVEGLTTGITIEDESAPDIGEQARIVTGEVSGEVAGFSQTAGAALSDGVLYTVNLSPGDDLDAAGELALAEALLRAMVDRA